MAHHSIIAALNAGILEPCVILDGEGRELHGYRPTIVGRRYFGNEDQSQTHVHAVMRALVAEHGATAIYEVLGRLTHHDDYP